MNVRDPEGRTALMLAVQSGKVGAVKALLGASRQSKHCRREGHDPVAYGSDQQAIENFRPSESRRRSLKRQPVLKP